MTDADLLATCIADEASNQPYEGKVAVGCVVLNRINSRYESDGTMIGTVLKHFQFSGFYFAMEEGHYTQIEFDQAGAQAEADKLFAEFSTQPIWSDCQRAVVDAYDWAAMQAGQLPAATLSFAPGPQFEKLTPRTMLYFNPRVCAAPAWATPDKLDAVVFQHSFYHP